MNRGGQTVHRETPSVRATMSADEAAAVHTVVLAFAADPVARWNWPQAQQYLENMPRLVRSFGDQAFAQGSGCCTDACTGAALWLAPGVRPDEESMTEIVQSTLPPSIRDDAFAVFEQMAHYHPEGPHWYLPLIGVDPAHQGQGIGDALMRYALQRCDQDHMPAYLESTNPRNVTLYRRHGFEELGTIRVGSSPPLVPMLRHPR